jgi:hypothetical protein
MQPGALLGRDIPSSASDYPSSSVIELTAAVAFKRRGVETKLMLPGRGRAWFDELATGRALSLQALAERDGITRRYIRRHCHGNGAAIRPRNRCY